MKYTIQSYFSNRPAGKMAQASPLLDSAALGYEEYLPTLYSVAGSSLLAIG